jgi:hypothetical protein
MAAWGVAILAVVVLAVGIGLWRNGRMSDRAMTLVVIGIAPLACLLYVALAGASVLALGLAALAALPGVLLYRTLRDFVAEQGELMRSGRTR